VPASVLTGMLHSSCGGSDGIIMVESKPKTADMRWNNGAGGRSGRSDWTSDGRMARAVFDATEQEQCVCCCNTSEGTSEPREGSGALDSLRALRVSPRQSGAGRLSHNVEVLASRWLAAKFATLHA